MLSSRRARGACRRATATCSSALPPPSVRLLSTLARRSAGTWLSSSSSSGCCSLQGGRQGAWGSSSSSRQSLRCTSLERQEELHRSCTDAHSRARPRSPTLPAHPPALLRGSLVLRGQVQGRGGAAARVAALDGWISARGQQQAHHVGRVGGHRPAAQRSRHSSRRACQCRLPSVQLDWFQHAALAVRCPCSQPQAQQPQQPTCRARWSRRTRRSRCRPGLARAQERVAAW